jgi:hypothetical protein
MAGLFAPLIQKRTVPTSPGVSTTAGGVLYARKMVFMQTNAHQINQKTTSDKERVGSAVTWLPRALVNARRGIAVAAAVCRAGAVA